jgi:SSS family solute:Na+ symporter
MHWIDLSIFIAYMIFMLGVGFFFFRKNDSHEDFFVAGRKMDSVHIGLSVVATDVGGGFSIGLGGLGFAIGISGSWMLFTGLIGAWLSAVILIPKVYKLADKHKLLSFPQIFEQFYGKHVALVAALISAIGYIGFTSSQILAGAKLASASFVGLNFKYALLIMGTIAIIYTVLGGLKAVIYTDTIQWLILILGLSAVGIPLSLKAIGGFEAIRTELPSAYISLNNISWKTMANWFITIVPIWFIGMTLYQRIYASGSTRKAQKAWFIAGIFEYPFMAFLGVFLGLFAKVAFINGHFTELGYAPSLDLDPELGLPLLLRTHLPIGMMGIMLSAYFSAIMSTADSCLIAASGNLLTDIFKFKGMRNQLKNSQVITLITGAFAMFIAYNMPKVLELMLNSYAVMVSGLFVPLIGALFFKVKHSLAAMISMISGGGLTLLFVILKLSLPFGLDPIFYGLGFSLLTFISVYKLNGLSRTTTST